MDLDFIEQHLRLVNILGYTLSTEERIKLGLGFIELASRKTNIQQFKFWGRIDTLTKPYYIIVGLNFTANYEFPHKTFFWASTNFVFAELPSPFQQHKDLCPKFKGLLTGDPNKVLVEQEAPAEEQIPPEDGGADGTNTAPKPVEEDEDKIELPKKNFLELHRLSQIVLSIENDAQIVVLGAYKMTPNHELHPNATFTGLKLNEALDPKNWQHFRAPQLEHKQKAIQAESVIFKKDFLDPISSDLPNGCWSVQKDCTNSAVTVRNLSWPGYVAYHRLNTPLSGSAYFGEGIKNVDLAFML